MSCWKTRNDFELDLEMMLNFNDKFPDSYVNTYAGVLQTGPTQAA